MLHLAMQPEKYLGKSPKQNRRQLHTKLPTWQRICIVAYALFWGFGLPFICFGAIAEPGHPHALPHFVFADPIDSESSNLAVRAMQLAGANDVVSKFYDQYLKPLTSTTSTGRSAGTKAGIPAGRAESSLAIFNLFTLAIKLRLICKYNDFNSISIIVVFDKKSTLWNLPAFVMVII